MSACTVACASLRSSDARPTARSAGNDGAFRCQGIRQAGGRGAMPWLGRALTVRACVPVTAGVSLGISLGNALGVSLGVRIGMADRPPAVDSAVDADVSGGCPQPARPTVA